MSEFGTCNRCRRVRIDAQRCFLCDRCHLLTRSENNNRPLCGSLGAPEIDLPVEIHAGFLCIIETDEELARLRNEEIREGNGPAYSKIEDSAGRVPVPIDRVAFRVAPTGSC